MTIILTGGGSGGHITPVLAVANELKKIDPKSRLIYIGQKGDSFVELPARHPAIDEVFTVRAGKFRRYQGSIIKQLLDFKTMFKNIRDFFYVATGFFQSLKLLKKINPDLIFIRGGFVGVPIGLAAAKQHRPFITHDSDAFPSLANRIVSRWAVVHAVAMPKQTYPYQQDRTVQVGVPVDDNYKFVSEKLKNDYKKQLGLYAKDRLILITGGGLGAQRINDVAIQIAPVLLDKYKDLAIAHLTGRQHYQGIADHYAHTFDENQKNRLIVKGFVDDLFRYSGAADIILCRAGATNLAEFALQQKACIVIPNPHLTKGHQVKNSQELARTGAVLAVDEQKIMSDPELLLQPIGELLDDPVRRQQLEKSISQFARPNATREIAELIVQTSQNEKSL